MKIRKSRTLSAFRLSLATIVAGGVMLGSAAAQEAEVTANAGWVSEYFYRGILQKTSSASAGLDVVFGPASVGTWLADVGDGTEIDLFGSVGADVEGLSLIAGGTAYLYTGEFDDTYLEANHRCGIRTPEPRIFDRPVRKLRWSDPGLLVSRRHGGARGVLWYVWGLRQ